ncbi:mechanosensitive ion channel domain-containing protein [Zhengella sp. ZM62]|uniref:mechanosensitive ion channel domain-containing protein n=1 Tax=Zhengella sedimenti TaxID=3390035 RepID=UPI003975F988
MPSTIYRTAFRLSFLALVAVFMLAAGGGTVLAQGSDNGILSEKRPVIEGLINSVEDLNASIDAVKENDNSLVQLQLKAEEAARSLLNESISFRPRLSEINARLEQLGQPPSDGQPPEPASVTEERNRLLEEKAAINDLLGRAENSSLSANRLADRINTIRRDLFTQALTRRYEINYGLIGQTIEDFETELQQLWWTFSNWLRFVTTFKAPSVLAATFLALLCAAVLMIGGRRVFGRVIRPDPAIEDPGYLARLSTAFWSTLLPALAFWVFLGATYFLLDTFQVLRSGIDRILFAVFEMAAVVFFVNRLARAVLKPSMPAWRLVAVDSRPALRLYWIATAMAFITGLDYVLNTINDVMMSPLSLTVAKGLTSTVLLGLIILGTGFIHPTTSADGKTKPWPTPVRILLFGLGALTVIASLLGYVGFAQFLGKQVVITGAILSTMYLGFKAAQAIAEEGNFERTLIGRALSGTGRSDSTTLDQLGLVASLGINFLVLLIGVPMILLQWGFQYADITAWAHRLATEVTVGNVSFSLVGILTGVLVFLLAYFATRWFQGWLDGHVLSRGRFDAGVRNSIRTAVGYLGVGLAVLIGISVAGIDLSNLALVAGALSLGIGFGLQTIVSNFVSGLILLAERPFKVGDWIEAGPHMGLVKKISVRATEIETFQRQTIILPNSDLINQAVGNRTHRNHLGRVDIPVGVSYSSDPAEVRDILLRLAEEHRLVLRNPPPVVYFAAFGASSLDFELRVYMADVFDILTVETDLRMAIHAAFKEAGIEIPFPQQDIHIRSGMPGDIRAVAEAMRPKQENGDTKGRQSDEEPEDPGKPGGTA